MADEAKILSLALKKITLDPRTQPREEMDQSVIEDYAEVLDELPPVVVFHDGTTYWMADGFHRYYAHETAGRRHILADVRTGGVRDAILFSCGVNAQHGLRRTNADKHRAVLTLLEDEEWSVWGNREIARQCVVSESMVRQVRGELRQKRAAQNAQLNDSEEVEENTDPDHVVDEANQDADEPGDVADETKSGQPCPHCGGTGRIP